MELYEYARLLATAKAEAEDWYAAVYLAGEAGLRVGEVKELQWREDVDMIARTITVKRQTYDGVTTSPKGRTRRTIPMTSTLHDGSSGGHPSNGRLSGGHPGGGRPLRETPSCELPKGIRACGSCVRDDLEELIVDRPPPRDARCDARRSR